MNDSHIRMAFKAKTLKRYYQAPGAIVIDELGIAHGSSRIDIAVITKRLLGYEIKSEKDTLRRLPQQIRYYNSVFNRVTLIVDYRHAYEALKIIPIWWGVRLVEMKSSGEVYFSIAREARENPSPDKYSIAQLLWRNEVLQILEETEADRSIRAKSRDELYKRIAESTEIDKLRASVCDQLKRRENWRVDVSQVSYAY